MLEVYFLSFVEVEQPCLEHMLITCLGKVGFRLHQGILRLVEFGDGSFSGLILGVHQFERSLRAPLDLFAAQEPVP